MNEKMIILDSSSKKLEDKTFIALGSFDGLHNGHITLINKVVDEALFNNCKSMVYTFKNHPLTVANPDKTPKLIMDNEQKIHILKTAGVDMVALIDFTHEYMQTSAEDFIKLLVEEYNAIGLVVGFNYKFGYKNLGDVELLKKLCEQHNIELFVIDPFSDDQGLISSTRIRGLIKEGKISEANSLLIEPFMIRGTVVPGKKNGKKLGFPTANISYDEKYVIPKDGVYYTNIMVEDKLYKGITSVGKNPTIDENLPVTIETYILDFDKDIYGEEVKLYFIEWMRDMEKYSNLDELVDQLRKDNNYAVLKEMTKLREEVK